MRKLVRAFWVVLALIFLLEAWLWDHLQPVVARVVAIVPWRRLKARVATVVRTLSPNATLVVFLVPVIVLLPLKFFEVWLLAHRYWLSAAALLVLAKLLGLGITAFVFDVTRAKLLRIDWFRRLYDTLIWLRQWAHDIVDPIQQRAKQWLRVFAPKQSGRAFRLLLRLRRRMQAHTAQ